MGLDKPGRLYQQIRRGSLSPEFQIDLQEIIRTQAPLPKSARSDQLMECRKRLETMYFSLGPKGRAQFATAFYEWLEGEHINKLRRLDISSAVASIQRGAG